MSNMHFHQQDRPYDPNSVDSYLHGAYGSSSTGPRHQHRPAFFMDRAQSVPEEPAPLVGEAGFDILEWHPAYQSCQRYFLDHAQHEPGTQALCALINIKLPYQWFGNAIATAVPNSSASPAQPAQQANGQFSFNHYPRASSSSNSMNSPNRSRNGQSNIPREPPTFVSLVPYIRRLVITGFDKPPILHGFFGDDYARGVLPHLDCERRNYLFAAKHGGWRTCKKQYDTGSGGGDDETVPFIKPLGDSTLEELNAAEKAWSGWLAMEDWMVGPRAPEEGEQGSGPRNSANAPDNPPDGVPEDYHRRM